MRIFSGGQEVSFASAVAKKTARLNADLRKKYLFLPVQEPLEAIEWILASFRSPLAVVPYPHDLPLASLERLTHCFSSGDFLWAADVPDQAFEASVPFREKSLDDVWLVVASSGSSGEPKAVALSGSALKSSAEAHAAHRGVGAAAWLLNLPLFHIGGFSILSRAYFLGGNVVLAGARFSAEQVAELMKSGIVEGMSLVPTALRRLLDLPNISVPASFRGILLGGAPASAELLAAANKKSLPVFCTYGLSENSSQVATEKKPGEGLRALPGVELRISEEGEILIRSPFLAAGYSREGKVTPLPLVDGFFPTGDLGSLESGVLKVVGRRTDLIVSGGLNVFPAEIEAELAQFEGLKDFAVTGLKNEEWGEVVCAAYVPTSADISAEKIRIFLRSRLDPRKVPKFLVKLSVIPRTPLGKVSRAQLREEIARQLPTASRS